MKRKLKRKLKLNHIYLGDVRKVLKTLPSNSVDCVITSPPYYNLRSYMPGKWIGGDINCEHIKSQAFSTKTTIHKTQKVNKNREIYYSKKCAKCGAIKEKDLQIGVEKTPEEFIENMVLIFHQAKRILKPTGTFFLNLGDTYSDGRNSKLPAKNLIGIPWRVALALQANGWILRQEIIWSKLSCLPESVEDRFTKSHEHVFFLTKSADYYFDHQSVKEPSTNKESYTGRRPRNPDQFGKDDPHRYALGIRKDGKLAMTGKKYPMRNKRSVWNLPTSNYKGGHFAAFNPKLVEPCILAGCPKDGVVLDPFFGSGTVGSVAKKYHRNYVGIELNPKYKKIAKQRITNTIKNLF